MHQLNLLTTPIETNVVALPKRNPLGNTLGDDEWYTPSCYIESARTVMGGIDLDPASNHIAQGWVKADRYFCKEQDGLAQPWAGRLWLNPPYSRGLINAFCSRLVEEYLNGLVAEAIVLVNAKMDTQWFDVLAKAQSARCEHRGRIAFIKEGGAKSNNSHGQCFFYYGSNSDRFKDEFRQYGRVY